MLSKHVVEANHSTGKLDMLSQHTQHKHTIQNTLCKLTCIKEAAKAQYSGQADTAMHSTTRRTRARGAAEQAATTPWETRQEAGGIGLHQLIGN